MTRSPTGSPSGSAAGSTCSAPAASPRCTRRLVAAGLRGRVLARPDGERLLTDLDHLGQLLHETARRQRLGLPALLEWFRAERRDAFASTERTRRLDTDAAAVQILTIHGSKGLQYPVVYLPALLRLLRPRARPSCSSTTTTGARRLDLGRVARGHPAGAGRGRRRGAAAHLRRADPCPVAGRHLVGAEPERRPLRPQPVAVRPDGRGGHRPRPGAGAHRLRGAGRAHGLAGRGRARARDGDGRRGAGTRRHGRRPGPLDVRRFMRTLDTDWRRTSYSGLIRAEEQLASTAVEVEPEVPGTVDEDSPAVEPVETTGAAGLDKLDHRDRASPMADLPAGRDLRVAGPRGARARRPAGSRPARRAAAPRRRSSCAGGRSTPPPTSWPRRWCRCSTPRSGRWQPASRLADIPLQRPAARARLRVPAGRRRPSRPRPARRPAPGGGRPCCAGTSPPTTRCGRTPTGWSRRRWAGSCCAAT